jgi:predicted alpha/beta superfamily hydrolase
LPPNFDAAKAYPVLYLLDGGLDEDFLHITGLMQFFNLQFKMPETIVVGIANVDRKRDFTFKTDDKKLQEEYPTTGHSAAFIQFLETELQPLMQKEYKTNGVKYLIGQSLGGLLATEILVKHPALFSHYLIVSPSLWWDDESLLKEVKKAAPQMPEQVKYIHISVGKKEHPVMQKDARSLYELIKKASDANLKVDFQLMPDNHATILHNSIYEALLKLFPFRE